jgi:hypothetical protein
MQVASMPDTKIVSFVLRFTQEQSAADACPRAWHGMLRHVQTNEQIHFTQLEEALAFIARYVDLGEGFVVTSDLHE